MLASQTRAVLSLLAVTDPAAGRTIVSSARCFRDEGGAVDITIVLQLVSPFWLGATQVPYPSIIVPAGGCDQRAIGTECPTECGLRMHEHNRRRAAH